MIPSLKTIVLIAFALLCVGYWLGARAWKH